MEIVEKRSINDSKQNFLLGLYKYYQICFENRLSWELSGMEAVLQADWSVKGLLTGTNFVVCSYGEFQPGRPGWNSRNKTNMVKHKLVSFATVIALWTLVNLLIKQIRTLLKWKYIHCKNYAILAAMMRKRSYFVKKVSSRSPGQECSYGKIFIPVTEISVAKTEISVTGPARALIWTYRIFYEGKTGEARSRKPSQPGWPGSYEEALN